MKNALLFILVFLSAVHAKAEQLYASSNGNSCQSTSCLGNQPLCAQIAFQSNFEPAQSDQFVKRDWYRNGVLIKISTDVSDNGTTTAMTIEGNNTVVCIYTVRNNGVISTRSTNTITVYVAPVGLDVSASAVPAIGCPPTITLQSNLSTQLTQLPPAGPFTINWTLPNGWTRVSGPANNNTMVVQPDAATSGTATANITLSCGVPLTRTISFSRTQLPAPPTFSSGNESYCSEETKTISVNPVCGAISYTYTLSGNLNFTFTENGQQTITTASTSVNVALASVININPAIISVTANFSSGQSTSTTSKSIFIGAATITGRYSINDSTTTHLLTIYPPNTPNPNMACSGYTIKTIMDVKNATNVTWSWAFSNNQGIFASQVGNNLHFGFYYPNITGHITVTASSICGSQSKTYEFRSYNCGGGIIIPPVAPPIYQNSTDSAGTHTSSISQMHIADKTAPLSIYPNPANNFIIAQILPVYIGYKLHVLNSQGQVMKVITTHTTEEHIGISTLTNGTYIVQLLGTKGKIITAQKVVIQH